MARKARMPHLLAALATAVSVVVQAMRGMDGLPQIAGQLAHPAQAAMVEIVWHSFTLTVAVFALALFATMKARPGAARAVAVLSALILGGAAGLTAAIAGDALGDPLAFYPVYFLGLAGALSAFAAARS